jgi:mono/diheme cytochrome c family protein
MSVRPGKAALFAFCLACSVACDDNDAPPVAFRVDNGIGGGAPVTAGSGGQPGFSLAGSSGSGPLFEGDLIQATRAAPISGGTLTVTRDGAYALAADSDRDQVYVVDLATREVKTCALEPGEEPGRVVEGATGTAYVVGRQSGAVVAIDVESASVVDRLLPCSAPRGLAFDATTSTLHVACRSGLLASYDVSSGEQTRAILLDDDLRDVLVRGEELVVTRWKSAEILLLDAAGMLVKRAIPQPAPFCAAATVASRSVIAADGTLVVAHQSSTNLEVGTQPGGYGFSCSGSIVTGALTLGDVDNPSTVQHPRTSTNDPRDSISLSMTFQSSTLDDGSGPFDVAIHDPSGRIAFLAPGNAYLDQANPLRVGERSLLETGGIDSFTQFPASGEPIAVAFDANGGYLLQSREPATLSFEDGSVVELSDDSRADTGLAMFHLNTGIGLACASCHPEGGDDGHTWHFAFGFRRTQQLEGGVLQRLPFHWNGEHETMQSLIDQVMIGRMSLPAHPSEEQVGALGAWLDTIAAPRPAEGLDATAVARGQAVFEREDVGCATCHVGAQLTDNSLHDVGTGGELITPTLIGVGLRAPLFHDGCAPNLDARFGLCGGGELHGKTAALTASELADLTAYLKSL